MPSDLTGLDETKPDGSIIPVSQLPVYQREVRSYLKGWAAIEHDLQGHHFLKVATASLALAGTINSASFTDLSLPATPGPSVSVVVGVSGQVLVGISCGLYAGVGDIAVVGFQLSGVNIRTVQNIETLENDSLIAIQSGTVAILTGLTPGSTTFGLLYRTNGIATATFYNRRIFVVAV